MAFGGYWVNSATKSEAAISQAQSLPSARALGASGPGRWTGSFGVSSLVPEDLALFCFGTTQNMINLTAMFLSPFFSLNTLSGLILKHDDQTPGVPSFLPP